ncbi:GlxA family transcriptional regulator [Comamonas humi]
MGGARLISAPKTTAIAPIRIAFLVFEGFQPIDLSGPWQAFTTANEESGRMLYELVTCGAQAVAATTGHGLRVLLDYTLGESHSLRPHTVIVPGGEGVHAAIGDAQMRDWLKHQDNVTERTCSVCTGVFLLAAAGLVDGREVTTHWRAAEQLRQQFPSVKVQDEQIYCESGKYWTTAGVTAGIDLALALIEQDGGALLTQKVSRRLVVHMRRSGDQRQYSQVLRAQDRAGAPFGALIERIESNITLPWTVDDMADASNMSRRTFQRRFKQSFGVTPVELLRTLRAERSQLLARAGKITRKEGYRLTRS